ncbi:MAG: undecaprenyl-phosphate glucose phosphotransferase [Hyphomicrobiales bacterium]|nr:undecaprenyl-phosphate glucose phosphotransferase [Hyphomicrobiales bacterium]
MFLIFDLLAIFLSGVAAKFFYIDLYLGNEDLLFKYIVLSAFLGIICSLFFEQLGLYKAELLPGPLIGFGKLWSSLALSFLVLLGILYVLKASDLFSRGWMLTWFTLSAGSLVLARWWTTRYLRRQIQAGNLKHTVAVFGTPAFTEAFRLEYDKNASLGGISDIYVTDPHGDGSDVDLRLQELRRAIQQGLYDTVIIALPITESETIEAAVKSLGSFSTELLLCSNLESYPCPISGSRSLGNLKMDVINIVPSSESGHIAKRCLDYVLAGAGLIALAPLLAIIAIAIKIDSPGPVFFRQRRYGQNNRIFRIFKFRTMTVAEDGPVVVQATRNDNRVTRIGRFLRSSSLDEIPQLINVLLGDMSIVGPRPHAIAHDEDFDARLDLFSRRRRVRPGITGWAQVNGYRGETNTLKCIQDRMQHDLYYIDNWSIWLDLEIVARTVLVLGKKAY